MVIAHKEFLLSFQNQPLEQPWKQKYNSSNLKAQPRVIKICSRIRSYPEITELSYLHKAASIYLTWTFLFNRAQCLEKDNCTMDTKMFRFYLTRDCHDLKFHILSELHCGCFLISRLHELWCELSQTWVPFPVVIICISWIRFLLTPLPTILGCPYSSECSISIPAHTQAADCPTPGGCVFSMQCGSWNVKAATMVKTAHTQTCSETLHITRFPLPSNGMFFPLCVH